MTAMICTLCYSDIWHQYDDVMQIAPIHGKHSLWNKMVSSAKTVIGWNKNQKGNESVSRLVNDKWIAAFTYLPRWKGFVGENAPPAEIKPTEAIKLVKQVRNWTMMSNFTYGCAPEMTMWVPDGFNANDVSKGYFVNQAGSVGSQEH